MELCKVAIIYYNKEIRSAKQSSWRDYYQGLKKYDRAVSWPRGWIYTNWKKRPYRNFTGLIFKIKIH
jgi:hypothetical protein